MASTQGKTTQDAVWITETFSENGATQILNNSLWKTPTKCDVDKILAAKFLGNSEGHLVPHNFETCLEDKDDTSPNFHSSMTMMDPDKFHVHQDLYTGWILGGIESLTFNHPVPNQRLPSDHSDHDN
ncbi:hypothetical protein AVEN_28018-1 [Araneus ventricosus]|uniref:Uncharacterized protein n=1 Tax=Araneus ventricosus TaxID=182803 RepID=A0A4Y2BH81_ARAVE|nr:hypothetical protein AVEN_28018-1 [Araneus ventricosus]